MFKLKIADLNVKVNPVNVNYFTDIFKDYLHNFDTLADFEISTKIVECITAPKGQVTEISKTINLIKIENGFNWFGLKFDDLDMFSSCIYFNDDWSKVEVQLLDRVYYKTLSVTEMEYIYITDAFSNRLTILGGACLHSSTISLDGIGIAFSANSGGGKSTQANLWEDYFQNRVIRINDDRPALKIIDDKVIIYGTPFSGKTNINTNTSVPLKAIVFVEKSKENRVEKISTKDILFNLTEQFPRTYYDKNVVNNNLSFIEKLISRVKIIKLCCDISNQAVTTLYNELFK